MIDRILNGLGDSSSSRSGSSSSSRNDTAQTYTIATPNGVASNLTLEQYNKVKQALADYNTAYGIAYSYNVSAPSWSDFHGDNGKELIDAVVIRVINSGNTTKSESWAKEFEKRAAELGIQTRPQAQTEPQMTAQYWATPYIQECIAYAKANNYPMPSRQWVESYGPKALDKLKEMVAESDRTGINIPDPYNVQPLPTAQPAGVQPAEKKQGSGLLFPGLILAAGIVAAILLTKKSRR